MLTSWLSWKNRSIFLMFKRLGTRNFSKSSSLPVRMASPASGVLLESTLWPLLSLRVRRSVGRLWLFSKLTATSSNWTVPPARVPGTLWQTMQPGFCLVPT
ncbi:hypothetical protein D3C87_1976460 [compost metagenome]